MSFSSVVTMSLKRAMSLKILSSHVSSKLFVLPRNRFSLYSDFNFQQTKKSDQTQWDYPASSELL